MSALVALRDFALYKMHLIIIIIIIMRRCFASYVTSKYTVRVDRRHKLLGTETQTVGLTVDD